ncbi:hypothetical protein P5V15_002784 [Pogonomyrmex californicus]
MRFQQDDTPPHKNSLITYFNEKFYTRIGTSSQTKEQLARSLDLTPIDFFLWGYVKEKVFAQPTTIADIKLRIVLSEISLIVHCKESKTIFDYA